MLCPAHKCCSPGRGEEASGERSQKMDRKNSKEEEQEGRRGDSGEWYAFSAPLWCQLVQFWKTSYLYTMCVTTTVSRDTERRQDPRPNTSEQVSTAVCIWNPHFIYLVCIHQFACGSKIRALLFEQPDDVTERVKTQQLWADCLNLRCSGKFSGLSSLSLHSSDLELGRYLCSWATVFFKLNKCLCWLGMQMIPL